MVESEGQARMRRLKILIWHIHGSYLDAITAIEHDWYLPIQEGKYGGRRLSSPPWVREVPGEKVRDLDLDLIVFQGAKNYLEDRDEILTEAQRSLPRIYLEHNTPKQSPYEERIPVDDPGVLVVHVTHYNRLMWENRKLETTVIEHSVSIDRTIQYDGGLARGLTVMNGMQHRPRISGYDIFLAARDQVPLDVCGIDTEEFGGLGDIKYRHLHRLLARYRFLFSPVRYTSLPLAVIEAMTIGMPVVALATTELPTVIVDGVNGYVSCDVERQIDRMRFLLDNPGEARRLGNNARATARGRFGMERFAREWNAAFERAIQLTST
jgi:hypothetical protein